MAATDAAIVRLCRPGAGRQTAGLGLLVGIDQVVTCAHVVNAALGRGLQEQEQPTDLVQVEFPLLKGTPVRLARVVAWEAPRGWDGDSDVAGLVLSERAPGDAVPARFAAALPAPGTLLRAFGYPESPARRDGMWVDAKLKGKVSNGLLQMESLSEQSVKAQPGYSGSPAWEHGGDEAIGLLKAAPFSEWPERDAYLLPPLAIAQVWNEPFDYLLVPDNPYRGLESFTAAQAGVFFGRDADIAALTDRVRSQPVVVVVGPSGVGKSSLVQAGLIPELEKGRQWSVAIARPRDDPWQRLAGALIRAQRGRAAEDWPTEEEVEREVTRLRKEGFGPVARFRRSQNRPLLVAVDQFEELLAGGDPDQELLDLLLPAPEKTDGAVRLVLTLRADFLPFLQSIPGFHSRLNERLYLLSPLTPEQMQEAVTGPAADRGLSFEPGLADQISRDAAGGSLPLLEFTLTMLWATQRRKTLTFAGYHEIGGVAGALGQVANESIAGLDPGAASALDRVLLKLVRAHGPDPGLATRQRIAQADVSDAEWELLWQLADARLVVLDTDAARGLPYAELAHDSLIVAWRRLRDLVTSNHDFLNWLARIRERAADHDPLPEERIPEARHWVETRPYDIPATIAAFINDSETAIEARMRALRQARDEAEAFRLAAEAELAFQSSNRSMTVALALGTESVLTKPTVQGDLALRRVLRLQPATIIRVDHDDTVRAVTFSPDGTKIATISSDKTARVFDAITGRELARFNHNGDNAGAIAFSPDGAKVVAATSSEAWVCDVATGQQRCLVNHRGSQPAVAFSPGGTRIVIAGRPSSVIDTETGQKLAQLDHNGHGTAVAFNPDGTRVAIACAGASRVFDSETGQGLISCNNRLGDDFAVAFSPDGGLIALGGFGGARILDAESGEELFALKHYGSVHAVAFSPDGTHIATASVHDRSARVFETESGYELARFLHDDAVNSAAFSPDGGRVATASRDGSMRVFDVETRHQVAWLDHDDDVKGIAFSSDGTRIATASADGYARVIDATHNHEPVRLDTLGPLGPAVFSPDGSLIAVGGEEPRVIDAVTGQEVTRLDSCGIVWGLAFSPDATQIAAACSNGPARICDVKTGLELTHLNNEGEVHRVAFSSDGTRIATASQDGLLQVFSTASGQELARVNHILEVWALALSPDGTRIATGSGEIATASGDASVRVLDAATGQELARLNHDGGIEAVAFSPDGTRVATASRDRSARVLDVACGQELARLNHDGGVGAVAFSPDGTRVATASRDGSARVLDVASGRDLIHLEHSESVTAVAFSPDGTRVVTCSDDDESVFVSVSEIDSQALLQTAFKVMSRPMNEAELRRYSLAPDCRHVARWNLERVSPK